MKDEKKHEPRSRHARDTKAAPHHSEGYRAAPRAGVYAFTFKGEGSGLSPAENAYGAVFLQRNSVDVVVGHSQINGANTEDTHPAFSIHATLKLNKGDTITIRHVIGIIFSNGNSHIQFTGSLLEEDLVIS